MSIINSDKFTAVFIDTNYYVSDKFNFNPSLFNSLKKISEVNSIKFITTTVTRYEMIKHLSLQLMEDSQIVNKMIKNLRLKSSSPYYPDQYMQYKEILSGTPKLLSNENTALTMSEEIIDKFLKDMNSLIIDVKSACPEKIFEYYFHSQHPFSGQKKHEFPDAFTLFSLLEQPEDILILSEDNDLYNFIKDDSYDGFGIVKTHTELIEILETQSIFSIDSNKNSLESKLKTFRAPILNNINLNQLISEKALELLSDNSYEQFTLLNEDMFHIEYHHVEYDDINLNIVDLPENLEFLSMDEDSTLAVKINNIEIPYSAILDISAHGYDSWDRDYIQIPTKRIPFDGQITITATFKIQFDSEFKQSLIENPKIIPDDIEDLPIFDLLIDCTDSNTPQIDLLNEMLA